MAYNKTNWQNAPSTDTPINANNLNKIEEGIYQNSLKADQVGDLTNLETDTKTNIVSAINELKDREVYSTSEVKTNKIWIDGKPIYRKAFQFTTANNTSWNLIENNNYDYVTDINGEVFASEHYIGITKYINFYRLNGNLYYQNQTTFSQGKQITFWIEYTKTTD